MSRQLLTNAETNLEQLHSYAEFRNIDSLKSNIDMVSAEVFHLLDDDKIKKTMEKSIINPNKVRGVMNDIITKIRDCDGKDVSYFKSMKRDIRDLEDVLATVRKDLNLAAPNSGGRRRTRRKRTRRSKSRRSKSRHSLSRRSRK